MPSQRPRIGNFELDRQTGELLKAGRAVPLQEQPFRVLLLILEHGGELTSREEIRKTLWPDDTFVDFDHGINTAIKKIRQALGDSTDDPKYIQTVARRGYRCIAAVEWPAEPAVKPQKSVAPASGVQPVTDRLVELHPEVSGMLEKDRSLREKEAGIQDQPATTESASAAKPASTVALDRAVEDHKHTISNLSRYKFWESRWARLTAATLLLAGVAAVMLLPLIGRLFNDRGFELQQHGELEAAIKNYERAITLDSAYAAAHYNLADAYEEIPNYEKAQGEYQRAIDADFRFYPAYNNLSRLYIRQRRDYSTALTLLDRALESNPREPSVQYSLRKNYGWADLELGNLSRAEQELRTATGLNEERGAAHCLLAKVLEAEGKAEEAQSEWEQCLAYSANPDVEPEWRVEAQERLGKKAVK